VGVTITFRDVTREREVDRMKTEFISTVSHELRTPLTSIKGALQLVMEEPEFHQNPMAEELLTISFTNTERLIRLINDILDISKIEAGRIQLKLDHHQVEEIVVAAVEGVRSFAGQRQITLRSDVAAGLPPVVVDLDRMIQVVTNLLSNAIKFSHEESTVTVEARAVAGEVEVRVQDQGKGIAPEDMDRLFKKFSQLDGSVVREVGGTGLGLAICKGIVEEHRGRIWVESEMGKGASFLFRLPVAGAAGLKSLKILVADDDPEMRQAVGELLRREVASLDLEFAVDGTEAMLRIGLFVPDLLILDNRMPGLDGIAVCRKIRENPELRGIKILGVTGFTEDLPLLREAGADESLAKPLDLGELRVALARLLGPRPVRETSTPVVIERGERLPKGVHRILVVDDEPDIRYILRQHLERQGHQVVEAASGLEALEKARALQPDLITLDVMMPDMDGFDVMKVLRGSEET
jgi:CheY-like chemotaxis protein